MTNSFDAAVSDPTSEKIAGMRSSTEAALPSSVWYAVGLLTIVNVFNLMDRMALSVLAPSIKADLGLSDSNIGLLTGIAFSLFYAVCGVPIARWADRGVRRNIIAVTLTIWSLMTALSGAAQNFAQLFVARVGVGAGEAGCLPTAQSIICDCVPLRRRASIFAIHQLGIYVGMMLGMVLAGWLGQYIGWRWAFLLLGLPGLMLALVVRLTLREPKRDLCEAAVTHGKSVSFAGVLLVIWRCRTYQLMLAFLVLNGFFQYGLLQWLPSYYSRVLALNLSAVGLYVGVAVGLGSAAGLLIGALLSNATVDRDVRLPLAIGASATAVAVPATLGVLFAPSAILSICFVALTALFWSVSNGPVVAALTSVTRSSMRATALSITTFLTSTIGFGLGPVCVGFLSDHLAPTYGSGSLRYALLGLIALLPPMVILLAAAARALPSDLRASDA